MTAKWMASLLVLAATAFAGDIAGTWKATAEGPNGPLERTFVFKVDGGTLTGETTSPTLGKSVIEDGKVDGDNISFGITAKIQGNEMKVSYKGKVTGDALKLTAAVAGYEGQSMEFTGKRVQ